MAMSDNFDEISAIFNQIPSPQAGMIQTLLAEKKAKILALENELNWLKEQVKLGQQRIFGRSSEKTENGQAEIIFNEEDSSELAELPTEEAETIHYIRRKPKQCGRKLDTSRLPCERQVHDLNETEKICSCGSHLEKIGENTSDQIEHIREQLKRIEHVCIKYTCRKCKTVKSASKPEAPLPKSMATAGFITDVIIKKYEHHLPLYRQSKILSQQGFEIPDNTLCNWVMGAGDVLFPLGEAAWQQLMKIKTLQADETPVTILNPHKEGYFWAYHSCDPANRFILFEFTLTRGSSHVNRRLSGYQGNLQTDGYSGYNGLRNQLGIVNFGCWDHARRRFMDVVKINGQNKSGKAGEMLLLIGKLYQIEVEAKNKSFTERKALRQEKASRILELIHNKLQKIHAPPQSALGKAVQYCLNQWVYLSRYVDYGEVEISNCWIENQIRPFAVGRRNWLFCGNEQSANKSALLYSLIQSCKLNNINPRSYLEYVLKQAHKMRRKEIDPVTLLPQFIDKNLLQSS